jgi:ribosomal protein S12 methylthiotransferase
MNSSKNKAFVGVSRGRKRPLRFYIASLGCPKNTVDAEGMSFILQRAGHRPTGDFECADLVIVNTCGFIAPARAESLETLELFASELREDQHLIATGCWTQRDPDLLREAIPRLDAIVGTRTWPSIEDVVEQLQKPDQEKPITWLGGPSLVMPEEAGAPGYTLAGASAFLKIADGCSRRCAFCAIPLIKGPYTSRPLEVILSEARALQARGVLEINLIAQDSTLYGHDLGMQHGIETLLERLVIEVPDVPWIRMLYAYPGYITPQLIEMLERYPQLLRYVDIPLQHAHPDVLQRMQRPADMAWVRETVGQLREVVPGVAIRTAFIVGFPGETDEEFQTLLDFVEEMRFDRLGAFIYSHEQGTSAGHLADDVPYDVKEARYQALMVAQQSISQAKNHEFIGDQLEVLLEGAGDGLTVGRSYRDAPEIDGLVLIQGEYPVNRMVGVRIVDATVYDLIGELVPND